MRHKINRAERKELLTALGALTLSIVALIDGATPDETAKAVACAADLLVTLKRALASAEPV